LSVVIMEIEEEEEDELEYYVTFPAAVSPELHEDSYAEVEKEPVVFLFGWGGCKDQHLAKYSEMYKDLGCVTIRYISPVNYIFFTPRALLDVADQLIDLITDLTLEVHPLLFHCFSNGGALVYRCLTRRLRERGLTLDVRGTVFDSGPIQPRLTNGWRAVQLCIQGERWYRWMLGMLFVLLALLRYLWAVTLGSAEHRLHPWSLTAAPERWPQMFLYSTADELTPAKDVEQFMSARRRLGVDVTGHVFEDSAHVLHYRAHPEQYRAAVATFVARVCRPGSSNSPRRRGTARPDSGDLRRREDGAAGSSESPGSGARATRPGSGDPIRREAAASTAK